MTQDLLVPEFNTFKEIIGDAFNTCKSNNSGKNADYIHFSMLKSHHGFIVEENSLLFSMLHICVAS